MTEDKRARPPRRRGRLDTQRILARWREALAAAAGTPPVRSRSASAPRSCPREPKDSPSVKATSQAPPAAAPPSPVAAQLSAADAVREAKTPGRGHYEAAEPTTRVARGKSGEAAGVLAAGPAKTQVVRGKPKVARASFEQDPVVGWLVVVGGPGLGSFRPIYEGNNAVGRGSDQRIAIDFGDNSISSTEQPTSATIDGSLVPVRAQPRQDQRVAVNNKKPTGAVKLEHMTSSPWAHAARVRAVRSEEFDGRSCRGSRSSSGLRARDPREQGCAQLPGGHGGRFAAFRRPHGGAG